MISDSERKQLNASAVEVFGTMYFTPVELLPELPARDSWQLEGQYVKTAISYAGPRQAGLCFYFPRSLAVSVAGGFLGVEEAAISDQQLIDTMREAANMIVGNFLGQIDPVGECALGIPVAEVVHGFSPDGVSQEGELLTFISDFGFLWMVHSV